MPCGEVVHVGFEILDNAKLASRHNVGTSVVKGECVDGRIMFLEDGYKECQPVPGREFPPTYRTGTVYDDLPMSTGARHQAGKRLMTIKIHELWRHSLDIEFCLWKCE